MRFNPLWVLWVDALFHSYDNNKMHRGSTVVHSMMDGDSVRWKPVTILSYNTAIRGSVFTKLKVRKDGVRIVIALKRPAEREDGESTTGLVLGSCMRFPTTRGWHDCTSVPEIFILRLIFKILRVRSTYRLYKKIIIIIIIFSWYVSWKHKIYYEETESQARTGGLTVTVGMIKKVWNCPMAEKSRLSNSGDCSIFATLQNERRDLRKQS